MVFTRVDYAAAALAKPYRELFLTTNLGYLGHNELTSLLRPARDGDSTALDAVTAFLRVPHAAAAYFDSQGRFSIIQFSYGPPPGHLSKSPSPATIAPVLMPWITADAAARILRPR